VGATTIFRAPAPWQRGDVVRGLDLADEPDTALADTAERLFALGLRPPRPSRRD
jgi:hypothetical protein